MSSADLIREARGRAKFFRRVAEVEPYIRDDEIVRVSENLSDLADALEVVERQCSTWSRTCEQLLNKLEVAEAHAAARGRLLANNPLLEYYAEALPKARTETADALARAERAEADNAALLAELERLRAVAALVRNTLGTVSYGRDGQLWWHELQCPSAADYFNECSPNCTKLRDALEARDE